MATATKKTKRTKLTRTDKLATALADADRSTLIVRVKGEIQGTLTAIIDPDWTGPGDEETCRYAVLDDSGDTVDSSDDLASIRETLAQTIRDMRAERLQEIADEAEAEAEELAEKEADDARELVEGLIERGRANEVVKALRAAGLI
jgi:acyl-CoA reductase-like NAD-dependent aldehyde dehydrogenase